MIGNHSKSVKAKGGLTATPTGGAGTKVGLSDPVVISGLCRFSLYLNTGKRLHHKRKDTDTIQELPPIGKRIGIRADACPVLEG